MKELQHYLLLLIAASILAGCTEDKEKDELTGNHIWKQQTDTLQTSKDVANQLQQSLDAQQEQLNNSSD